MSAPCEVSSPGPPRRPARLLPADVLVTEYRYRAALWPPLLLFLRYGVAVQDFAGSWRSGLAFLAVIKAIDPSLVDMKQALQDSMRENLEKAFSIAHDALHIPRLLEPEGSVGLPLSSWLRIFITCVIHAVQVENLENPEKSNEDVFISPLFLPRRSFFQYFPVHLITNFLHLGSFGVCIVLSLTFFKDLML